MQSAGEVRRTVRERYGEIARGERTGCGPGPEAVASSSCGCMPAETKSATLGYSDSDLGALPEGADLGLGCGNPGAIARLEPGQTVLDLGSGGGIDCFLAAEKVGSDGHVIGVDMTPDMIERARANAVKGNASNVEFRLGEIENLPIADDSVDVILSNCVINLSTDKPRVYREAFRVTRPGGRLAISDIVAKADLPEKIRADLDLHAGCVAGAATREEVMRQVSEAGFVDVKVTLANDTPPNGSESPNDWVASASIEAVKPA